MHVCVKALKIGIDSVMQSLALDFWDVFML